MSLPRAVLEAEEKANKAHEELLKQQQNTENTDPPPSDPPPGDPPPADPAPPTDPADSGHPQPGNEDTSEHRFKVLQGKYNSEVPRLNAENKDLKARLQQMEHDLEVLKNSKPPEALVKPEEIEQYGEGLIDVARRIAREELASKDAEIQTLKSRLDSLSTTTTQNVEASFFKSLTEMVPDWEQVNQDPKFLTWLDEVDELTGESRQSLLSRAEKSRDAARTAKFFNAYKKTSSSWAANTTQALESQVAPSTNKAPNAPPAKKVWTRAEVADFYARARRGDIKDEDVIAIEADIMSAQIEGRKR